MSTEKEEEVESPDVHFEPIVQLPAVEYKPTEENEEEIFKIRAKLFRFDTKAEPPEWKERGTGEVKFLRHMKKSQVRLLMRRDKTHKVCANHFITKEMALLPNAGSDKAWVWTVQADYADEQPKVEQLAIKFKNAENAQKFKEQFVQCQDLLSTPDDTSALADKMATLEVESKEKESGDTENKSQKQGEGNTESSKPTDNTELSKPTGNTESSKPTDNTELSKPTGNTESSKPTDNTELSKPTEEVAETKKDVAHE